MSSQSSEEDCPVTYRPLDKNIFKETYPYMWYTVEEDEDEPVPPRFKHESMEALCRKIIKLEMENDELRIDNSILRCKLEEKKDKPNTSSPSPPSSSPKEIKYQVWCRWEMTPMGSLGSLLRLAGTGLCKERVW